jgi:putative RecB family exonuclease
MSDILENSKTDKQLTLPAYISPSRLKDFELCPQKFYYGSIERIPQKPTIAQLTGTLAHSVFQMIFTHPPVERSVDLAKAYVQSAWEVLVNPTKPPSETRSIYEDNLRKEQNLYSIVAGSYEARRAESMRDGYLELMKTSSLEELLENVSEIVENYFTLEHPERFTPEARELQLKAEILGIPLLGYLDRLDRFVTSKGEERWYISDYKTGKIPGDRFLEESFFAMKVYALLIKELQGIDVYQLRLIYVKYSGDGAIKRKNLTQEDLEETKAKIDKLWKAIVFDFKNDSWEPRVNKLCGWCDFKEICPAFT